MKNIFVIFFLITFSILTTDLKAETRKVPNNQSKIENHKVFPDSIDSIILLVANSISCIKKGLCYLSLLG